MQIFSRLFFVVLNVFSIAHLSAEANECKENFKFSFDDRDWVQGFEDSNGDTSIVEFTLKGESVENWSELVTVQRLVSFAASTEDYYTFFIEDLNQSVSPASVKSRIINKSDKGIFFEWWINGKVQETQHEWFKLIKTPQSTMVLRYTTKKLNEVKKIRSIWEKNLNEATVITDCSKKPAGIFIPASN